MLRIGITGGIGSGKTTVSGVFKALNIPVYNSDERAKYIGDHHEEARNLITAEFGSNSYTESGLDRAFLAQVVFNDPIKLQALNAIIHPLVGQDYNDWVLQHEHHPYTLKEAAILFESGAYQSCDQVILIRAEEEIRIQRVVRRDGSTPEEVKRRIQNQWSDNKKASLAEYIIDNSGSELIIPQVMQIHQKLLAS